MIQENVNPWNIKKIYEILRRQLTPGYKCGTKFDSVWITLSDFLKTQKICPVTYLESLFELWGHTPYPNQLCSDRAINIYKDYIDRYTTIGQREFETQVATLNKCLDIYYKDNGKNIEDQLDKILTSDFLPIKNYIRVIFCSDNVLNEIIQKYGSVAVAELKSNPSTNKYIKNNYVSRYIRLFPQRIPKSPSSESDTLPEPSTATERRKNIPVRRRSSNP